MTRLLEPAHGEDLQEVPPVLGFLDDAARGPVDVRGQGALIPLEADGQRDPDRTGALRRLTDPHIGVARAA